MLAEAALAATGDDAAAVVDSVDLVLPLAASYVDVNADHDDDPVPFPVFTDSALALL